MPSKLQMYEQMADRTAKQVTGSFGEWTAFLETMGRLYKYPFHEQLMIFAQKPNATACADYDLWNKQMGRYVRRGSKGIALIDTSGDNPRLKYVFDVSDTGGRENSRRLNLWEYKDEHQDAVTASLENRFGVSGEKGLADQLEQIASKLVTEYWNDNSRDILGILEDSFLEEYDDYNVEVAFRNAATVSTTYTLMSRCGLNPGDYFEHKDFLSVFDFNTRDTIAVLGSAVSNSSEQILRQIAVTVKNYEREASLLRQAERTQNDGKQSGLHAERGLLDSQSDLERDRTEASGQVRTHEETVSAGAPAGAVEQHDTVGDPVPPSEGDRRDGEPQTGTDDAGTDETEWRDRGAESERPDDVDGTHEQPQKPGRGNHPHRTDSRITGQLTLFDVGLFPTEQEQIAIIDEAESVKPTPFAFSFAQRDIDDVLRLASNSEHTRMNVAAAFQKQKSAEEIAELLQKEYHGGAGMKSANGEFSVWYAEDGIHLAKGRSARYSRSAQVISWEAAAERIGQLMDDGRYASNVELAEAELHERTELSHKLWYLRGDLSDDAREKGILSVLEDYHKGGFPDATARLAEDLKDPAFRQMIAADCSAFMEAYKADRDIMRFHYHKPLEIWNALQDLDLPRREYTSDMAEVPKVGMFITEDEIDAALNKGSNVEGGKGRIYTYLTGSHNSKEKTDFLKNEYGIGGSSHAVSGQGWIESSGKGIRLRKPDCADVELNWNKVLSRFENIIRNGRYFTPEEKARYEEMQSREWQFRKHMSQLTGKSEEELASELRGVIYMDFNRKPDGSYTWRTADDFLSGNVREKLAYYQRALEMLPEDANHRNEIADNVAALKTAQPKDLDASEIEVRLGATWIDKSYIQQFMVETFEPPYYLRRSIEVNYSPFSAEWNITGKSQPSYSDVNAYMTYGTDRANAYKILEDTLNLRDVRIYDTVTDPDGKERRVLNSKETTLAQQKQQAIKDAFQDWIWKDPDRRQELVTRYNELFNSNRPREYDGSHIVFSGMNPEIKLREHQLNAVAHILYGGNTLLAHEVGAGKTFEMVAAAMESKRLGLCQKPLFVVPNHLTEQWASEFLRLYPSANILAATKKDFEPRNRKKFCGRIATGDYDAIIIGHSQFERIPVSQERQERLLQEQIMEIEEGLEELKASRAERFTIKSLERTKKGLETRLKKLQDSTRKDDVITFEQLGVDRLYVDEAHSFKNLFLYTKMRNVAGLSTSDAQKSSDMLLKCRYIDELTDSRGVVFATGTPVSNSMTELYTMMRYLQHDTIRDKGLAHFDCWASTFGETTTAIELAPEGTGYRARTRFAKFFNLPELMNLFKEAADIKTADQLNLPTPKAIYHNEVAQPTEIQQAMVQELSERAAAVHAGTVDPSVDNMLRITSDGRKLGLDQRIINPNLPDEPTSKVNMCVDNIHRIWEEGHDNKLTQLVFCDLSTPKSSATKRAAKAPAGNLDNPELRALEHLAQKDGIDEEPSFTVYDDIREKLVARGIPREQIAFIHEANTEARKKELFGKVRSGQVRVLMGSTFKMGAGMNVQDRLIALHDLDAPWRPGDLEQRSGRIIRQGNMNPEVHIYRYVTEATFDAYLWQTLENKQKFISQIMTSKSPVRACDDIDETALSYAEIKALCAGDERIKEKMDLDVDVARLKLMKANHQSQQYRLEDNLLRYFPEQIEQNKGYIAGFEADMKTLAEYPHPADGFSGMTVRGDVLTDKENAGAALVDAFKEVKGLDSIPVGSYRGFQMSLTLEDFGRDYVLTLKGQMTHRVTLGKDPRGNLTRIDNALNGMADRLATVQSRLESLYSQMETAKAELGKPFPQEDELRVKSARLAELNIALNIDDKTPLEAMAEEDPPRAEIAKSAKPSVLQKLHSYDKAGRTEPTKKHKEEAVR